MHKRCRFVINSQSDTRRGEWRNHTCARGLNGNMGTGTRASTDRDAANEGIRRNERENEGMREG